MVTILWALFMISLFTWPDNLTPFFLALQSAAAMIFCAFFMMLLWRLRRWQWQFGLTERGAIYQLGGVPCQGEESGASVSEEPAEVLSAWVMPLLCVLHIKSPDGTRRLGLIFADMLSDADYRSLCRILLAVNARGSG